MSKKEFDDFLRKEEEKKEPQIDWDARKNLWLNFLDTLYTDVQNWLKEYIDNNKVSVDFNDFVMYEEVLGTYHVQMMRIKINGKIVTLEPIGTILIGGAKGRVDMTGNAGTIRLILAERNAIEPKIDVNVYFSSEKIRKKQDMEEKKPDLVWKISTNPPKVKYSDLNQDTFLKCLIQVCNGQ